MTAHLENERAAILEAALRHVPFDGWTDAALRAAVKDAGFEPGMAKRAFPDGGLGLIAAFVADADRRMTKALEERDLASLPIRERLATTVRVRLEQNEPYEEAIRRAVGTQTRGPGALSAAFGVYRTVDAMWRAAVDDSTDFSFYTKRGLLAGVYVATLLYWLDDQSDGHADTWEFLDRRISDVLNIRKIRGEVEALCRRVPDLRSFLRRSPLRTASWRCARKGRTSHPAA